jgi:predicted RNA-binding protein
MTQTDVELMEAYMKLNSKHLSMVAATQHIDQEVGREMEKTIGALNMFVSKVQMQSQMIERDALEKQKDMRKGGASSMFDTNRKSMATTLSSNLDQQSNN